MLTETYNNPTKHIVLVVQDEYEQDIGLVNNSYCGVHTPQIKLPA